MRHALNHPHILLVEGEADRSCIEQLCIELNISPRVFLPATPKDLLNPAYNSKQGVYTALDDLLEQLQDQSLERLAIIVDADQQQDGQGYQVSFNKISEILQAHSYSFDQALSQQAQGLVFTHNNGLNPIGVWIMPNNQDSGVIEHWIAETIDNTKCSLFSHAQTTIKTLPTRTFAGNKLAKAEIATWLAWQKSPSIGLYAAVPLLDKNADLHKKLVTWLQFIFS